MTFEADRWRKSVGGSTRGYRLGLSAARLGSVLALSLTALAFIAGSASAAEVHVFSSSFGEPGPGSGQLSLGEHSGVAVNAESGNVYVADTGNSRVAEFEADGTFVRNFGSSAAPTYIAIDNSAGSSAGDVYVADSASGSVSKFEADGTPVTTWAGGGSLSGFPELQGIAVAPDGDLFVLDGAGFAEVTAHRYGADGTPVGTPFLAGEPGDSPLGLAVDTEGNLYRATGGGEVFKFSPTGEGLGRPTSFGVRYALGTDPANGDLYSIDGEQRVDRYAANCGEGCPPLERFAEGELTGPSGVAVGPTSNVYVTDSGSSTVRIYALENVEPPLVSINAPTAVSSFSAHLSGEVDPEGAATSCEFQVVTSADFEAAGFEGSGTQRDPCATSPGSGTNPVSVEADAEGLLPGTKYYARLVASSPGGTTTSPEPNPTFTTLAAAPTISAEFASGITATGAILNATIVSGGASTTYHFDYVSEASYLVEGFAGPDVISTPESGPLLGDNLPHKVSAGIEGLTPGQAYRFQVVATNSVEAVAGTPAAFIAQALSLLPEGNCANQIFRAGFAANLPDCRAYEQASPADKGGLNVEALGNLAAASPDGSSVTYYSQAGSGFPDTAGGHQELSTILASRGPLGWSNQRLLPPESFGAKANFIGSTPDQRFAVVEAIQEGTGPGTGRGLFVIETATGTIKEIVSYDQNRLGRYALDGASKDGSQLFFETVAQLLPSATPGRPNLYMWNRSTGAVSLVGVLPGQTAEAPPGGSFGGAYAWWDERNPAQGGSLRGLYVEALHAISPDGDQVYFTAGDTGQLYLRRGLTGTSPTTLRVSKPNDGVEDQFVEEEGGRQRLAAFQEASPDGSYAFFLSSQKLTEGVDTGPEDEGSELYRWNADTEELVAVAAELQGPNGATVAGLLGASSDGKSGYLVARGILPSGGVQGGYNLYRFVERPDGSFNLEFVTQLANSESYSSEASDLRNWSPETGQGGAISAEGSFSRTSRVTPDGRTLIFSSVLPLTGYENRPCPSSAEGRCVEIFRYTAGDLAPTCISCNPTGEPPSASAELAAPSLKAYLTPVTAPESILTRNLSADGDRVFFQSADPLVAGDTNGGLNCTYAVTPTGSNIHKSSDCEDVYEWEAPGAPGGSCRGPEVGGGCLYLLSTGKERQASDFLDASVDGRDVFIATASRLVPADRDEVYDAYDVRTDGGLASQFATATPSCQSGESCQGAVSSPPITPSPGTSAFQGEGNVNPHRRHQKRCHRAHHQGCAGAKHHKRHHHKRPRPSRIAGAANRSSK